MKSDSLKGTKNSFQNQTYLTTIFLVTDAP